VGHLVCMGTEGMKMVGRLWHTLDENIEMKSVTWMILIMILTDGRLMNLAVE